MVHGFNVIKRKLKVRSYNPGLSGSYLLHWPDNILYQGAQAAFQGLADGTSTTLYFFPASFLVGTSVKMGIV